MPHELNVLALDNPPFVLRPAVHCQCANPAGGRGRSQKISRAALFPAIWDRGSAGGVKAIPLAKAMHTASLQPEHVIALVDTVEGLGMVRELGASSILMINDYEQGRRLALYAPSGGIVSLKGLPDAISLVAEIAKAPRS